MEGFFKGWIPKQSHGFIIPEGEDDSPQGGVLLLNASVQDPERFRRATKLRFEVTHDALGRRQATNIELLGGKPLLEGVGTVVSWVVKPSGAYGFLRIGERKVFLRDTLLPKDTTYLSVGDQVGMRYEPEDKLEKGKKVEGGVVFKVTKIAGWKEPSDPFDAFSDMGDPRRWLVDLARMAEEESWDFHTSRAFSPILHGYLRHTFRRLHEMPGGIAYSGGNNQYAAFNTGLVTRELEEDIFAVFEKNGAPGHQPWCFSGFHKPSSNLIANVFGAKLPPLADYFDDPACLLFDRRFKIIPNYDHIFEHMERFPVQVQGKSKMQLKHVLDAAVDDAQRRAARNNQVAVAQYFRDSGHAGQVQLLLPLSLEQTHPPQVDLALVLGLTETGDAYSGHSVLTLDMAYSNARLLMRPESNWLNPNKIDE
jgi:hypothetical protein